MANFIAGSILLLIVAAIIASLVRKKRAGQCLMCDCGSSCSRKPGKSSQEACGCASCADGGNGAFSGAAKGACNCGPTCDCADGALDCGCASTGRSSASAGRSCHCGGRCAEVSDLWRIVCEQKRGETAKEPC